MTASGQRKKNRKRASDKRTQLNNQKKLDQLKKIRKNVQTDSRGKVKDTKPKLISNIGKNADYGQRAAKLKQSMGGIGSMKDYKKTEKKAFKEAEKYQKKKKKEEDKKNKLKIKKNKSTTTGGGSRTPSGKGVRDKFVRYKGKMYRRGTPMAKKAEAAEAARKRLGAKGYMRR